MQDVRNQLTSLPESVAAKSCYSNSIRLGRGGHSDDETKLIYTVFFFFEQQTLCFINNTQKDGIGCQNQ